jgi:hypothetical protein
MLLLTSLMERRQAESIGEPLSNLSCGVPYLNQSSTDDTLTDRITQIKLVDPVMADRLTEINAAITSNDYHKQANYAFFDLYRIFDLDAYMERVQDKFFRRPLLLACLEWIRNVLVLVPIMLTWYGLSQASTNYNQLILRFPDLVTKPFLLSWEQGFVELGSRRGPTFSELAFIDFIILFFVVLLTLYIDYRRNVQRSNSEVAALRHRSNLDSILWELSVHTASVKQTLDPAQALVGLQRSVVTFPEKANELIALLKTEHNRLEQLSARRERELGSLGLFSDNLSSYVTQIVAVAQEGSKSQQVLQTSVASLNIDINRLVENQQGLSTQLSALNAQSAGLTETARAMKETNELAVVRFTEATNEVLNRSTIVVDSVADVSKVLDVLLSAERSLIHSVGNLEKTTNTLDSYMRYIAQRTIDWPELVNGINKYMDQITKSNAAVANQMVAISDQHARWEGSANDSGRALVEQTGRLLGATDVLSKVNSELLEIIQTLNKETRQLAETTSHSQGAQEQGFAQLSQLHQSNQELANRLQTVVDRQSEALDNSSRIAENMAGLESQLTYAVAKLARQLFKLRQIGTDLEESGFTNAVIELSKSRLTENKGPNFWPFTRGRHNNRDGKSEGEQVGPLN